MVECQIYLYCEIDEWTYRRDISLLNTVTTERMLRLRTYCEFSGFIESMPLYVSVVSDEHNLTAEELADMKVFEINEAMPEYDIPSNSSATIPINKDEFDDLKECLVSASNDPNLSIVVCLGLGGLQKVLPDREKIVPADGQTVIINEFSWSLSGDIELISTE